MAAPSRGVPAATPMPSNMVMKTCMCGEPVGEALRPATRPFPRTPFQPLQVLNDRVRAREEHCAVRRSLQISNVPLELRHQGLQRWPHSRGERVRFFLCLLLLPWSLLPRSLASSGGKPPHDTLTQLNDGVEGADAVWVGTLDLGW